VATKLARPQADTPPAGDSGDGALNVGAPAVHVEELSKSFGHLFALKKVSLAVPSGQFLTIFGPNGAGKSTLIRILSTLSKASSGRISILGAQPGEESESIRGQIGVIGHQTFLYEELTAIENLRFYGQLYGVSGLEARIQESLEEVGLQVRGGSRVRTFSRGMQQRLAIARAMLHQPSILLLDEPYTGLDQHATRVLTDWLAKLRQENRTTLMVTHNIDRGVELADRIVVMKSGRVIYDQPADGIEANAFKQTYYDLVDEAEASR